MNDNDVTNAFSPRTNRRVANVLLAVGAALMLWFPYSTWTQLQFSTAAVDAVGTIIQQDGRIDVNFVTQSGAAVTTRLTGWRRKNHAHLERVHIVYHPRDPRQVMLWSSVWMGPVFSLIFSIATMTIGWRLRSGAMVVGPLRQSRVRIGF